MMSFPKRHDCPRKRKGTHRKETVNGSKIIDKPTYNKIIKPILKKVLMLESLQMNGYND